MGCALHDFFPAQAYFIFNETQSQQGLARFSKMKLANLVLQGQEIVVKKDCDGGYRVILGKCSIVNFARTVRFGIGHLIRGTGTWFRISGWQSK